MTAYKLALVALLFCLVFTQGLHAQVGSVFQFGNWSDSLKLSFARIATNVEVSAPTPQYFPNSGTQIPLEVLVPNSTYPSGSSKPSYGQSKPFASLLSVRNGFLRYDWDYRSGVDTPYVEDNLSQHHLYASADVTVADYLPIRVTYTERRSNSDWFRDFRDVRIEFNPAEFQRIQAAHVRQVLMREVERLRNPHVEPLLQRANSLKERLSSLLLAPQFRKRYIDAKEVLLVPDLTDTMANGLKDSVLAAAQAYVNTYEEVEKQKDQYKQLSDSLSQVNIQVGKKAQALASLLNGNVFDPSIEKELRHALVADGLRPEWPSRPMQAFSGVRRFAIGRTMPSFSPLTVQNVNVKGINFEYNYCNFYVAVAAGGVDYRIRDFFSARKNLPKQSLYAVRLGYGQIDGNHVIATYFQGTKQLLPGLTNGAVQGIRGTSLAVQYVVAQAHRVNFEFAQSAAPSLLPVSGGAPTKLRFSDPNSRAYAVSLHSFISQTKTRLNGRYQYAGINFQSFTSYSTSTSATSWAIKAEQPLFKRRLHLSFAMRKNDFVNPLVLQRYSANAVFVNLSATYRAPRRPTLSVAYMPSSQFSVVDSAVYENHYQLLNVTGSHHYQIGYAKAATSLMYNRFYNSSHDSGFVYYNANNFFLSQFFQFPAFTSSLNLNYTANGSYALAVFDGSLAVNVRRGNAVGIGVKLNALNTQSQLRIGFYGNGRYAIPRLGELAMLLERSYLPDAGHSLQKRDFFTLSFTRFF